MVRVQLREAPPVLAAHHSVDAKPFSSTPLSTARGLGPSEKPSTHARVRVGEEQEYYLTYFRTSDVTSFSKFESLKVVGDREREKMNLEFSGNEIRNMELVFHLLIEKKSSA